MSSDNILRVTRTYTQRIAAPPEAVFPLICPVREAEWLDGWTYQMVYSDSGLAEQACVFTTQHPGEPDSVWVITRHDAQAGVVVFLKVIPGWTVTNLVVQLSDADDGTTAAQVTYTYTALSEMGAKAIARHHSEEVFRQQMAWWERSMNHYLRTGETLRGHGA